jgi:hypothetical protein
MRGQLEAALGLKVQVAKIAYPRPGCTLLEGLELADPETGKAVATVRLAEISTDEHGETIFASQPEVDVAAAEQLKTFIGSRMRRTVTAHAADLRFVANELTVRWADGAQTFVDCSAQLGSTSDGCAATGSLRLANSDAAQAIRFEWRRSNQLGEPLDSVQIGAANAPLPVSLIAVLAERENRWGPHCTVQGTIKAMETPDSWQAEVAGRLANIDLHSAVSSQFPHQLSGTAELTVKHAVVHAGRLEEAEGSIHAGQGSVGPSLLMAAAAVLGLTRGGNNSSANGLVGNEMTGNVTAYDELAADFELDARGFSVHGRCGGKREGTILRNGEQVLLADSDRGPVPVVALVKMLVPDSRVQVPATRQTDWLLHLLPVPDVVPGDPQAVPQARLRGGKGLH